MAYTIHPGLGGTVVTNSATGKKYVIEGRGEASKAKAYALIKKLTTPRKKPNQGKAKPNGKK